MGLAAPRLPLVVGGSGQVGRHMLVALAEAGCENVRVLDVRPPDHTPSGLNVDFRHHRLGGEGSRRLPSILQDVDCVLNLLGADTENATEKELRRTCINGVEELLQGCRSEGVEKFVHASCVAVTDSQKASEHQSEETALPDLNEYTSPYDRALREGEDAVLAANTSGLATVSLRAGNLIAGPWDRVLLPMMKQQPGTVVSLEDSAQADYMAAADFCRAMIAAAERLDSPAVAGQAIFVTKGEAKHPHEVAEELAKLLGWNCVLLPAFAQSAIGFGMQLRRRAWDFLGQESTGVAPADELRSGRVEKTFDNMRALYTLDFESQTSIGDALSEAVAEYREKHPKPE